MCFHGRIKQDWNKAETVFMAEANRQLNWNSVGQCSYQSCLSVNQWQSCLSVQLPEIETEFKRLNWNSVGQCKKIQKKFRYLIKMVSARRLASPVGQLVSWKIQKKSVETHLVACLNSLETELDETDQLEFSLCLQLLACSLEFVPEHRIQFVAHSDAFRWKYWIQFVGRTEKLNLLIFS